MSKIMSVSYTQGLAFLRPGRLFTTWELFSVVLSLSFCCLMPRALEFSPELSPWIYLEVVPVLAGILTGLEIGWFSRLSYWDIFVKENGSDPTMDKILYWPSIPTLSLVVGFLNFASILMLFEGQNLWDRLTPSCCFMIPMFITFSILANLIVVGPESLYEASSESGDSEGEI